MRKKTCLSLLICVNLILLSAIVLIGTSPRTAHAQSQVGLADNFIVVTGEIQDEFDALYIVDTNEHTLHVFYFRRGTTDLKYGGYRLLDLDLRHHRS